MAVNDVYRRKIREEKRKQRALNNNSSATSPFNSVQRNSRMRDSIIKESGISGISKGSRTGRRKLSEVSLQQSRILESRREEDDESTAMNTQVLEFLNRLGRDR